MDKSEESWLWAKPSSEVLSLVDSHEQNGLTSKQVLERQQRDGRNEVTKKSTHSPAQILLRQFQSPLIFILILAVVATVALAEYLDALIITFAILTNAGLGFYQEFKAERTIQQLQSFISVRSRVIRDGREQEIDAYEVVVGDLIHLTSGSRVPADGRLLKVSSLQVDEAILTGESLPEQKSIESVPAETVLADRTNMVYGGTLVTEGSAWYVVTATGMKTEFGKIARLVIDTEHEKTPIQKAVHQLAWIIAGAILIIVSGVFVLGVSRGETIFDMFMISVAVAVGAIPEALPIGLTAVLAVGVERLAKRKGVMRSLSAAETLGSTTVIMTDKTGTLTEAKLQLVHILTAKELVTNDVLGNSSLPAVLTAEQQDILYTALFATDVAIENIDDVSTDWRLVGNPLETTIVRMAGQYSLSVGDRMKRVPVIGFNSKYKFSVSAAPLRLSSDLTGQRFGYAHIVMGAPDVILARSTISAEERVVLEKQLETLSYDGKRVLGIAVQYPSDIADNSTAITPETVCDLTFLGILAFVDPVRQSVPQAVRAIEDYGVRVLIATGDLAGTAVAVAKELGWSVSKEEIITGEELSHLSDAELSARVRTLKVCARVTPADKLRIAQCLQAQGEIVAMTGDGVNDAPSLKAVDIGIAVGSGSDVAKGVSDLILLDDDFGTIVAAIEEGKRVLANIRKTFVYLMSNSLDEVVLISGSLIVGLALPLSAMQIIWVNFFTGSLPAIAFAFDNQTEAKSKTKGRQKIISSQVKTLVISIGVSVSLLLFALYYVLSQTTLSHEYVRTFIFACFSMYILCIAFSLRNLEAPIFSYNPFSNKFLNFGVLVGIGLTLTTIYVPFMQSIFNTTTLPLSWWWGVGVWLLFTIVLVESCKWISGRLYR